MPPADANPRRPALTRDAIGDAAHAIRTLALAHGVTADPAPIDAFVDAAARLSDNDPGLDHQERLIVALGRAGVITDDEAFALHIAYIRQNG